MTLTDFLAQTLGSDDPNKIQIRSDSHLYSIVNLRPLLEIMGGDWAAILNRIPECQDKRG